MNKKDYRGYELIKAIHDGEIKDGAIIEVHDLSTLDHVKARITFRNKKLNWISGEFDTSCLFDDNIYFRVLEDNTEDIEELEYFNIGEAKNTSQTKMIDKINELVKAVNAIRKDLNK
jgi:hypothetical protein